MVLQYYSDLHLEFDSCPIAAGDIRPDTDLLVLAGDIAVETWNLLEFLDNLPAIPILYVLGNHEFYGKPYNSTVDRFREALAPYLHVHLLERDEAVLNGVRFLGTTLWSDLAGGRHRDACEMGLADYRYIYGDSGHPITPDVTLQEHRQSVAWLEGRLAMPLGGPTVVVTHHAPSFRSQPPRFAGSRIGGGFCANLDALIERYQPDVWIHGHLHDSADYRIGRTRVVCNPFGYERHEVNREFRHTRVEVG